MASRLSGSDRLFLVFLVLVTLAGVWAVLHFQAPRPPDVVVNVPEPETPDPLPNLGYTEPDSMRFVPWPNAEEAGISEEQFRNDCTQVCTQSRGFGEERAPGRVLYMHPEHLLCACFHPTNGFPITRYVAWEQVR